MTKKHFEHFIFDDDILGELPEFNTNSKKPNLKKRNNTDNKKVLFRDNLSQMVEPVESFMLSIPHSDALDSQVLEELEDDYKQISSDLEVDRFKRPVLDINSMEISNVKDDSRFDGSSYMRSMTSSEVRELIPQSLQDELNEDSIQLGSIEREEDTRTRSSEIEEDKLEDEEEEKSKSLDVSVHSEVKGPNLLIKTEAISMENGRVVNESKGEISFENKKGHYKFEKDGSVSEGDVEADSYNDFLKKIYEPLLGEQLMSSDLSADENISKSESESSNVSTEQKPNELIINISHDDNDADNNESKEEEED